MVRKEAILLHHHLLGLLPRRSLALLSQTVDEGLFILLLCLKHTNQYTAQSGSVLKTNIVHAVVVQPVVAQHQLTMVHRPYKDQTMKDILVDDTTSIDHQTNTDTERGVEVGAQVLSIIVATTDIIVTGETMNPRESMSNTIQSTTWYAVHLIVLQEIVIITTTVCASQSHTDEVLLIIMTAL